MKLGFISILKLTSTATRVRLLRSLPQILLPSTEPTMTAPSSQTMQIFCPSEFHCIPLTTDLFLLLIISSYHEPTRRRIIYMRAYRINKIYHISHKVAAAWNSLNRNLKYKPNNGKISKQVFKYILVSCKGREIYYVIREIAIKVSKIDKLPL